MYSYSLSDHYQGFQHVNNHHNRFTALFPGPPGWVGARRELLNFMVQGKIDRGRHNDHPAGRHSIRTNQCSPPPFPHIFTGWMPFLPPNQQRQSTEGKSNMLTKEPQTFCLRENWTASVVSPPRIGLVWVAECWGAAPASAHRGIPQQHHNQQTVPPCWVRCETLVAPNTPVSSTSDNLLMPEKTTQQAQMVQTIQYNMNARACNFIWNNNQKTTHLTALYPGRPRCAGTRKHSLTRILSLWLLYNIFTYYGHPMEQGRPLYFHPVDSSSFFLSFFLV